MVKCWEEIILCRTHFLQLNALAYSNVLSKFFRNSASKFGNAAHPNDASGIEPKKNVIFFLTELIVIHSWIKIYEWNSSRDFEWKSQNSFK